MSPRISLAIALGAAVVAATAARAQDEVPRAPRLEARTVINVPVPDTRPSPVLSIERLKPPTPTRLAPLPEPRTESPDEIVVIGRGWRLPDLGSAWRARQQATAASSRFQATALPFYDPDRPPLANAAPLLDSEQRRQGYIELFKLRFGRRSTPE
jgi:hypothetical protein